MKEVIELSDCPENLQQSINSYLSNFPKAEVLSVQKYLQTPYKDKTITDTTYKVFTLYGNLFKVYRLSICSKDEWDDREIKINKMLAGEIDEIVSLNSVWFQK